MIASSLVCVLACAAQPNDQPADGGTQNDPRREICERLDQCVGRRATLMVDDCLAALAGDDDELVVTCAACFRTIQEPCPPDDSCEDSCPQHGF